MIDPDLKAALAEFAQRRRRGQPHLAVEELEAYHWGDLAPDRQETARDHLAVCPECVALLAALDSFPTVLAADDGQVPEADVEEALAATLARVRPQEAGIAQSAAGIDSGARRLRWWKARGSQAFAAAALAALLVVAVGSGIATRFSNRRAAVLAAQVSGLERELARAGDARERLALELERSRHELAAAQERIAASNDVAEDWLRPHVNTPVELLRATRMRGSEAEVPAKVSLPAGAGFLTLVLEDPQDERFPDYRVELRGPRGERVGEADGLKHTTYRNFVVTLPRQILPAGRLDVRLVGVARGGAEKEIATYAVEIVR